MGSKLESNSTLDVKYLDKLSLEFVRNWEKPFLEKKRNEKFVVFVE